GRLWHWLTQAAVGVAHRRDRALVEWTEIAGGGILACLLLHQHAGNGTADRRKRQAETQGELTCSLPGLRLRVLAHLPGAARPPCNLLARPSAAMVVRGKNRLLTNLAGEKAEAQWRARDDGARRGGGRIEQTAVKSAVIEQIEIDLQGVGMQMLQRNETILRGPN